MANIERTDSERIDWLEAQGDVMAGVDFMNYDHALDWKAEMPRAAPRNLREAIDEAIARADDPEIKRTPSTADAVPNPTADANERATAESQKTTPCGAARRAAGNVNGFNVSVSLLEADADVIDEQFRPLIEAAHKLEREVSACWGMEYAAREAFGNTNYACVQQRIEELRAALRTIEED